MLGCLVDIILTCVTFGLWIPLRLFVFKGKKTSKKKDTVSRGKKRSRSLNLSLANYEDLPRLEAPAGYVYVIQDTSHSQQYKIGRTNHPARRLNKFDVVLPINTKIVALLRTNDASSLENRLHRRYGKARTRGEWFELDPKHIKEIRSM